MIYFMNELRISNEKGTFYVCFHDIEPCGNGTLQIRALADVQTTIFHVHVDCNLYIRDLEQWRDDLQAMLRWGQREVTFAPLGEFLSITLKLENDSISIQGDISDTALPQSMLEFYNTASRSDVQSLYEQLDSLLARM